MSLSPHEVAVAALLWLGLGVAVIVFLCRGWGLFDDEGEESETKILADLERRKREKNTGEKSSDS